MEKILDMKEVFLYSVFFCSLPTDVAWEMFFFCSCQVIALPFFWKMALVTNNNGCNLFMFQYNG